ncbi:MAG: hypothetical protein QOD39_926 [Mycobacterium sp.]|jgi:replicative DNA helicase|nr:hypothetical protein [Mycobacterium sp.]
MDDDVRSAEQAVVAGLTLEPDRVREVGWLSPADFGSPVCRLLFTRVLETHASSGSVDGTGLLDALRARGELRSDGYPVAPLTGWLAAVPTPAALPVYARLVVDGAVARRIEATGVRLLQLASRGEPLRALGGAEGQRTLLWVEQRRIVRLADPTAGGSERGSVRRIGASPPPPTPSADGDVAHAELVTVGSVITAPGLMARLETWLRSEDFASPECGVVFSRASRMVADGMPVDRLTVRDQIRRHGELPDRQCAELLARAEAAVPHAASAGFYGQRVLGASALRQVAAAGEELVGLGRERRGNGRELLSAALGRLDGLVELRRRVWRSRGSVPPAGRPDVVRPAARVVRPELTSRVGRD